MDEEVDDFFTRVNLNADYMPFLYNIFDSIATMNHDFNNDMMLEEARLESMETFQNELFRRDRSVSISEEYKRKRFNPEKHRNHKCFICMEDYKDKELVILLDCGHIHHPACIKQAVQFNTICPICKEPIKIKTTEPISQSAVDTSDTSSSSP